ASAARRRWDVVPWVFWVAAAGVSAEWLSTFAPLPMNVALCQHRTLWLIRIAAITGIWGVSGLLWLSNAALANALLRGRGTAGGSPSPLPPQLWRAERSFPGLTGTVAPFAWPRSRNLTARKWRGRSASARRRSKLRTGRP